MKNLLLILTLLFNCTNLNAQDKDPWGEYMTPSNVHTLLAQYTGSFKMEITMSMGEGKEPTIITVNSEHIMLLGGRFLEMKQKGTMMGMDYQSPYYESDFFPKVMEQIQNNKKKCNLKQSGNSLILVYDNIKTMHETQMIFKEVDEKVFGV